MLLIAGVILGASVMLFICVLGAGAIVRDFETLPKK